MLYTGSNLDISDEYDEVWYIVRSPKVIKKIEGVNVRHVPELSPSFELFQKYLNAKKAGVWTKNYFEHEFKPEFKKEMKSEESQKALDELYKTSRGKDVLIVCYCMNESRCHRSIIKEIIKEREKEEREKEEREKEEEER